MSRKLGDCLAPVRKRHAAQALHGSSAREQCASGLRQRAFCLLVPQVERDVALAQSELQVQQLLAAARPQRAPRWREVRSDVFTRQHAMPVCDARAGRSPVLWNEPRVPRRLQRMNKRVMRTAGMGFLVMGVSVMPARPATAHTTTCERAKHDLMSLSAALTLYAAEYGKLPEAARWFEELRAVKIIAARAAGLDPWGRRYRFTPRGREFELRSIGPDGAVGTEDDQFVTSQGEQSECAKLGGWLPSPGCAS